MTAARATSSTVTTVPRTWEQTHGTTRPSARYAPELTLAELAKLRAKEAVCDAYRATLSNRDQFARRRLREALDRLWRLEDVTRAVP